MKLENKTKKERKELIDELKALRERVSELERRERDSRQALGNFGERADIFFSQMSHMHEAIFVLFDRKLEYVNDRFTELFGVSPEVACNSNFDPMTLIAPESRRFIQELYKEGCCGAFTTKQVNFTGLSKDGLKMECETFLLIIPYKWGIAIHGTLRNLSVSRRIDEELQRHQSDLRVVFNAVPTGVLYADTDHRFMQVNETLGKSNGLLLEKIPRVDYPGKPTNGTALS
ncbi:MAG: PAS domain-containing protein [Syntrophaceae bacterium]